MFDRFQKLTFNSQNKLKFCFTDICIQKFRKGLNKEVDIY